MLVKDQSRLDIRKYSFSQRKTNEQMEQIIYRLCNVNMFKNNVDTYHRRADYT